MQLDTSLFFSDRIIFTPESKKLFEVRSGFLELCQRVITWIVSFFYYSEENIKSVSCFKKYLVDTLGGERLKRISSRHGIDLDEMTKNGSPLLSRDVAKIVTSTKVLTLEDINEKNGGCSLLSKEKLSDIFDELTHLLSPELEVGPIEGEITGRPTEFFSRFFFDTLLAEREKLELVKEHQEDTFETFAHNMVARVIKRELDVGELIPAPNHPDGSRQFYYVSAKLVTGEGMLSYILHPATNDTNLKPIRLFRGTSPRNSDLDGLSTVITDLECELGRSAYESGKIYDQTIEETIGAPEIEIGHSLGSTLVQYRLANTDHIRKAYLFSGPGIPEQEAMRFNQKNNPTELVIRRTATDYFYTLGKIHLGFKAPSNVNVDFLKYHSPKFAKHIPNPHVTIWEKEDHIYGIEGGFTKEMLDVELEHKNNFSEFIRSIFGPPLSLFLRGIRSIVRIGGNCRIHEQVGLQIGKFQNGAWHVDHFRLI